MAFSAKRTLRALNGGVQQNRSGGFARSKEMSYLGGMRLLILLLLLPCFCFGQNLVPNPSFEDTVGCPTTVMEINKCADWSSFRSSPDFFHSCAPQTPNWPSTPINFFGHQQPASGDGYIGLYTLLPQAITEKEAAGAQLSAPMIVGLKYYVSFQVSLADTFVDQCFTSKLGARFSMMSYSQGNPTSVNNTAHVYTDSIITDIDNWVQVAGSFTTDSAYQYVSIGSFFDDLNIDSFCFDGNGVASYYYVDDVCVSTDSAFCANFVSVKEQIKQQTFTIYPNPTTGVATITNPDSYRDEQGITNVEVFDLFGRSVPFDFNIGRSLLDIRSSPQGVYFVRVGNSVRKLVKQ